jgi:hypothetical protein
MDKSFKMQPTMTLREELSNFHFEEYQFSMKDNQESHEEDQFMEEPKPETDLMYQS